MSKDAPHRRTEPQVIESRRAALSLAVQLAAGRPINPQCVLDIAKSFEAYLAPVLDTPSSEL